MEIYLLKHAAWLENENRVRHFPAMLAAILLMAGGLGLLADARPAEISDSELIQLVDQSDLILVGKTRITCGSYTGEGPGPDGIHPTPEYRRFIFPVSIDRILKGTSAQSIPLLLSYTALVYGPKDPPSKIMSGRFSIKMDSKEPVLPMEGAPLAGKSYVFFLQNRKVREPSSYEAAGTQEIIYNNFDFKYGMLPANRTLVKKVVKLSAAG